MYHDHAEFLPECKPGLIAEDQLIEQNKGKSLYFHLN